MTCLTEELYAGDTSARAATAAVILASSEGMPEPFTTRLAPSPTGALHLGNARTFALTWWWARAHAARIVLRIEDLDSPRKKPGAIDALREDLSWLGLDWDAETPLQTSRVARHRDALARLLADGCVYACICSRRDVDEAQSAPHEAPGDLVYGGRCRDLGLPPAEAAARAGRPAALRFRVPDLPVVVDDAVLGASAFEMPAESGDFVVGRVTADGVMAPGYQVAVACDDADDLVTFVIRGADLHISAARQRLIQRALGLPTVGYAHVPLVVGRDGRRLAKRHGDTRLSTLRASGETPDAVWAWIAESVGRAASSPAMLVEGGFDPAWIPRAPVVVPARWSIP